MLGASLVWWVACGEKPAATPAKPVKLAPPPPTALATPEPLPVVAPEAPAPPANPPTSAVAVPMQNVRAEHFSIMSQALLTFRRDKDRGPRDWQELIATGYLKQLPLAPAGKRYTFNPGSLDVGMVDQ